MFDKHGVNFSGRDGAPGVAHPHLVSPGSLSAGGAQEGLPAGEELQWGRRVLQRARV